MSDYTHINLKEDVDDQAPNFGLAGDIEARMARVPLGMENSGLSYLRLAPGFRLPWRRRSRAAGLARRPSEMTGRHDRTQSANVRSGSLIELFPDTAAVEDGELVVGGVRASALAREFGTPLVVYCRDTVLARARAYAR